MHVSTDNSEQDALRALPLASNANAVPAKHVTYEHHFRPIDRFGFPRAWRCWCGSRLEFMPREAGRDSKRKDWFAAHRECTPPGWEQSV